jgi:hypothetical protein
MIPGRQPRPRNFVAHHGSPDLSSFQLLVGASVTRSTVHRLIGAHGMSRLPANQKHRPHGN